MDGVLSLGLWVGVGESLPFSSSPPSTEYSPEVVERAFSQTNLQILYFAFMLRVLLNGLLNMWK